MGTAASLAVYVGCQGTLIEGDLMFEVRVLDARQVWSRTDLLVTPVAGCGQRWVSADRVKGLRVATNEH